MTWAEGSAKDTLLTSPWMEDEQAVMALWLTQVDGLALKVEVLQHQDEVAALRGWLHPSAHLTALDVIPEGEGSWGTQQNSALHRLEAHRDSQKVIIRNKSFRWVTVQILRTNPFYYCPHVRDEEKGSERFFALSKTTQ